MLETLDERADQLLVELTSGRTVTDRVMRAISRQLKDERLNIDVVAKGLAMSSRSLQRALSEEGTTYQELLEQTRRGLAIRYLADPGAVIFEVAILLGFSEPSAFHRAFKRWTGHTPRQFQRLGAEVSPF
jgi:AraC-like DNA-binding protein